MPLNRTHDCLNATKAIFDTLCTMLKSHFHKVRSSDTHRVEATGCNCYAKRSLQTLTSWTAFFLMPWRYYFKVAVPFAESPREIYQHIEHCKSMMWKSRICAGEMYSLSVSCVRIQAPIWLSLFCFWLSIFSSPWGHHCNSQTNIHLCYIFWTVFLIPSEQNKKEKENKRMTKKKFQKYESINKCIRSKFTYTTDCFSAFWVVVLSMLLPHAGCLCVRQPLSHSSGDFSQVLGHLCQRHSLLPLWLCGVWWCWAVCCRTGRRTGKPVLQEVLLWYWKW